MFSVKYFALFACILSVCLAAPVHQHPFALKQSLLGSWIISEKTVSLSTGSVLESKPLYQYNVTKNDIPDEFVFTLVDINTFERVPVSYEYILLATSNSTGIVRKYEPSSEEEIQNLFEIVLEEQLKNEVFSATGKITNSEYNFEFTTYQKDHISLKFTNYQKDKAIIISAARVVIPPEKTFFQKYGTWIIIGVSVFMQFSMALCLPSN
ncbi:hypothetical protein WA158_007262 [Blastocystis sp. Blastoise]